jgi:hypothetical protein
MTLSVKAYLGEVGLRDVYSAHSDHDQCPASKNRRKRLDGMGRRPMFSLSRHHYRD